MKTHVAMSAIALLVALVGANKIDLYIPCVKTENCTNIPSLPPETICQEGYCLCPSDKGFVNCSSINQTFIHQTRTPGPLVYRTCKHNQDCNFQGGLCNTTNHQCVCSKDYVPSSDNRHCVQKAQSINSSCTEDNQCLAFLANTTCRLNKCHCITGYHYVDSACWRMAGYGQPCTKNQECSHIEGAICTDNMTCECGAETVLSKDGKKCLAAARNIRDECTESVQCETFEHSSCIENMCQCSEGYHYEHSMTRCFLNRELDAECANNYECYQVEDYKSDPPIRSLICEANKCTCAENYVRKDNVCANGSSLIFASFPVITLIVLVWVNL
ncbi:prion-like-(Q/N-rich) domain-bearing protein 25 isoform X2 [Odontomachus brunneus]|uniref:prion-like-(Q/N-rich) domain-bearing protein 25 isoform X2 n=1 Tax=Odontomachus brunneus TaxID=486640 RepID=UPI0013F2A208|nr:prion-like-(Q/N-rich) domain-bearing protein 25 isoform X2 [Odontomachus brunneus]